jgi:hypothetical protein
MDIFGHQLLRGKPAIKVLWRERRFFSAALTRVKKMQKSSRLIPKKTNSPHIKKSLT